MKFFEKNFVKDNPNPNATIGFLCWNPFHYYVYKNIYRYFPNSEFIIGERRYWNDALEQENILRVKRFLEEKGVKWRFFDETASGPEKRAFFRKYKAIISVWHIRSLIFRGLIDDSILKIRVLYGNAKDIYNFGLWSADFDLILTYGPYSQKFLEVYTNAIIVGNPKFDDWFLDTIDQQTIDDIKNRLDPAKKTILYLPTHDAQKGMSSLPLLLKEDRTVLKQYNFILKLHYSTRLDEKKMANDLERMNLLIFDEYDDILPLLKTADYVLSDNSGAIFDALLAQKPVILFESSEKIYDKKLFVGAKGATGFLTNSSSLEQKVKQKETAIGPVIRSFSNLPKAILKIEDGHSFFQLNSEKIIKDIFGFRDGNCGTRAAEEIKKSLRDFGDGTLSHPFIFWAQARENLITRGILEMRNRSPLLKKLQLIFRDYFGEE